MPGGTLSPTQSAWIDRARDADILGVAQRPPVAAVLKKRSREWVGPCPACGGDDRFAVNQTKKGGIFNCRGFGGGNVVTMVMHVCNVKFLEACEIINREPMPAAESRISAEELRRAAEERERLRAEREEERDRAENQFRDRERRTLWDIWCRAGELAGSPAEAYLALRLPGFPDTAGIRLRCVHDMPYFIQRGKGAPEIVARAAAMIAPILRPDGRFGGLHFTYLDLTEPKGKARLTDGAELLPAKKTRGSKKGGHIELVRVAAPSQLIIGEGIEKVLAVWLALTRCGRDLSGTAFWTSADLGNLGGRAAASVAHPTLKTDKGRPQRVPGPVPDLASPGLPIPDSVTDVVLLGDSTSDRFTTQCVLARAGARFAREGRTVRVAWAPEGADFDDLVREAGP